MAKVYSQNGYRANVRSLMATYTIPNTGGIRITLRKGYCSVLLLDYLSWYHNNIEHLTQADTGGYAERDIRGSNEVSNHASGTSADHRWNKHPLGKDNTHTEAQQKKIRAKIKTYNGALRWGGDYKGRKDPMHVEINANYAKVTSVAQSLKKPPAPAKPPKDDMTKPIEVDGALGPKTILRWQGIMKNPTGVTGVWSENWVKFVQLYLQERVDHRLKIDGDWGPESIRALQRYLNAPVDGVISKPKSITIIALQRRLNEGRF